MAWEGIEERFKKAFTVKVSFRAGTIGFPDTRLTIDDWLESIAESDEEVLELEIPRIQFLENRWLIDELVQLEWDDEFSNRRAILAMYVGRRAYILFSDWTEYLVIAALEPKDKPALYRAVVGNILENRSFVPTRPTRILNHRPDVIPEVVPLSKKQPPEPGLEFPELTGFGRSAWKEFLSDVLVGWIVTGINVPEFGFWHEDTPESVMSASEEEIRMKYKRTA